jgi:hypothetical protein
MSNTTVLPLRQPDTVEDPLTAILRSGARRLLAQAIEAEAEAFLAGMKEERLADGRERLVRHGHGPERLVQTGIGPVPVRRVKLRDRGAGDGTERIRFTSAILPRWARRTPSLDALAVGGRGRPRHGGAGEDVGPCALAGAALEQVTRGRGGGRCGARRRVPPWCFRRGA